MYDLGDSFMCTKKKGTSDLLFFIKVSIKIRVFTEICLPIGIKSPPKRFQLIKLRFALFSFHHINTNN